VVQDVTSKNASFGVESYPAGYTQMTPTSRVGAIGYNILRTKYLKLPLLSGDVKSERTSPSVASSSMMPSYKWCRQLRKPDPYQ
jgi:hypothetical protein